jgi:hypothetical protein
MRPGHHLKSLPLVSASAWFNKELSMGVVLMENYEVDSPAALTDKGWVLPTTSVNTITAFTENGITRKSLVSDRIVAGNSFDPIKIPVPASKFFYFSTRVRWASSGIGDSGLRLSVSSANTYAGAINAAYSFAFAQPQGTGWRIFANATTSGQYVDFGVNEWITLEILRKADGTIRVWVNDILLYTPSVVNTWPVDNYIYVGRVQVGGSSGGSARFGWQFADTVVIDPSTAGLQNRPGSKSRVVSVPFVSDVSAQWQLPSGVTGAHYPFMADYPATVDTTRILTGDTAGQREQYQSGALPMVVTGADKVLSLMMEQRPSNGGGTSHSFATEVDVGSGIVEVAQNQLAGGAAFSYRPIFLDKKPDGSDWTASDIAALKAGFSIKS